MSRKIRQYALPEWIAACCDDNDLESVNDEVIHERGEDQDDVRSKKSNQVAPSPFPKEQDTDEEADDGQICK